MLSTCKKKNQFSCRTLNKFSHRMGNAPGTNHLGLTKPVMKTLTKWKRFLLLSSVRSFHHTLLASDCHCSLTALLINTINLDTINTIGCYSLSLSRLLELLLLFRWPHVKIKIMDRFQVGMKWMHNILEILSIYL